MREQLIDAVPTRQPLSIGQQALWFHQQADRESNAYNLGACFRFAQPIDITFLQGVLDRAGERHPLLRARFDLIEGEACWWVSQEPPTCTVFAAGDVTSESALASCEDFLLHRYDLARDSPFRFAVQAAEGGCIVAIGCHHIIGDLHSLAALVQELGADDGTTSAPREDAGYATFARAQRDFPASREGAAAAAFWRDRLADVFPRLGLDLGALESGSPSPVDAAGRLEFSFDDAISTSLKRLATDGGASEFSFLLTTFQALLARYSDRDVVVVGAPSASRFQPHFRRTFGYFVNLLPMVFRLDPTETFAAALQRNGADVRSALRRGSLPFECMVQAMPTLASSIGATLSFQRTSDGLDASLTRVALGLPGGSVRLAGQVGVLLPIAEPRAQFPMGLALAPVPEGYAGFLQFDPGRISGDSATGFLRGWLELVRLCCERPAASLGELLDGAVGRPFVGHADTLAAAIEDAFVLHGDRIAVRDAETELSYRDLEARSRALACSLIAGGVGSGDRVAVVGDGGIRTIVSLLGVLRTGAAFVPMEAGTSPSRLRELQTIARVATVLGVDFEPEVAIDMPATLSDVSVAPLDPAWLMFTSGTTGRPRAAVVPQAAALAHAQGIAQRFALTTDDRVLQFASLSFDEHAEEIFPTLLAGGCIVCSTNIRYEDPERLIAVLRRHAVSVLHLPTSYWHLWCDELAHQAQPLPSSLRLMNVGGEQASLTRLRRWARWAPPHVRWFNSYGLTEAAVTSLLFEMRPDLADSMDAVPVGMPLPGSRVRIVDDRGHDVPPGASGELLLGGAGVGTGYFDAPEATTVRFFVEAGVRWLRTGDLARRVGREVVIIGRRDRVVKLRGMRVDLSDAEAALAAHPGVLECALDHNADDAGLRAYVVPRNGCTLDAAEVQNLVQAHAAAGPLPVPVQLQRLDAIPRTPGRKPDYAALAAAVTPRVASEPAAATRGLEDIVQATFERLLQHPHVDPNASFFALGGHSLLAMSAVAALRRELSVDLSIMDFMGAPTVRGIGGICRLRGATLASPNPIALPVPPLYALSRSQRRVLAIAAWAVHEIPRGGCTLRISGAVDHRLVTRAWSAVLHAHPLLAAEIGAAGNREPLPSEVAAEVRLVVLDFSEHMPRKQRAVEMKRLLAEARSGHGSTATLFRISPGEHLLVVEASLAAVDGDSAALLLAEFLRACADESRPVSSPASYARYVDAEAAWLASTAADVARAWWSDRLQASPAPTVLGSMSGSADPASSRLRCGLGPQARSAILSLAASQACSPFAVLLAGFLVLLARHTGRDDILIGVPVSLRDRLGGNYACGPTLNPLPFRARVDSRESFATIVTRVQVDMAAALEHAPLPYEEIAAASMTERGAPLPIQFVSQTPLPRSTAGGLRLEPEPPARDGSSLVGLLASACIEEAGISLEFEYRRDALSDAEAVALLRSYRRLLAELASAPKNATGAARALAWSDIRKSMAIRPRAAGRSASTLLHAGLHATAIADPGRVAIAWGAERLTYAEVDAWTDLHARRLIAAGVKPGDRVVVVSRMGVEEVIAACAVLKAGATYVPVAHDLPGEAASRLATRVRAQAVTGAADVAPAWAMPEGGSYIAVMREETPKTPLALAPEVAPSTSAYILFTSGSSGDPKGVEVSHLAAMETVDEIRARFSLGPDDVFYRQAELVFDLSVFDVFGAFAAGAMLVLPRGSARGDAFAYANDVARHGVTVWNSVPAALDMLLDAAAPPGLPSLRAVFASGDWIPLDLPRRTRTASPTAMFVSLGGATEASIWSCFHEVACVESSWRSIPYGRALGGQSMFIADEHGWPVPRGVAGQIHIGGNALAEGYWGDPERTAARFPVHPLNGNRTYATGDLGCTLPDGSIEFLGRMDDQVKVRGTRIDLREIERVLAVHPGVRRVLVAALPVENGRAIEAIGAYVVAEDGHQVDIADLRHHALQHLTRAMRPTTYRQIAYVPVTANGKTDWSALPPLGQRAGLGRKTGEQIATQGELAMFALWRELLPNASFGRYDDFFELGGHSLLAMRLLASVRRTTGREVPLAHWLEQPTVAHLAKLVECPLSLSTRGSGRARDLHGRIQLDDDLVFTSPRTAGGACVVTGATGIIGSHIVARLLKRADVEVICLDRDPQRQGSLADRLAPLLTAEDASWRDRLRCIRGDLTEPRFGLDVTSFSALARETGQVIHAGAQVSLVAPYAALARTNVAGTHEAIRLAGLAGAVLCHVSSVGVIPYGAGRLVREDESLDGDGSLLTGYCQSKWVAEQTVRAAMVRGLRAMIFRPGLTIGDTGMSAERDLLALIVALSRKAGCLPAIEFPVDLVDADYAAAAIEHIASDPRAVLHTFHLTHPHPLRVRELYDSIDARMPVTPFGEWQRIAATLASTLPDDSLTALATVVAQHSEQELTPARIDCSNTHSFLRGSGIGCAPIAEILARALPGLGITEH